MTNLELVLNMLAEASTTEISRKKKPQGLPANKEVARQGGAAGKARAEIEKQTGESVITNSHARALEVEKAKMVSQKKGKFRRGKN